MAENQRNESFPLSEAADNFCGIREANQTNLQQMEQLFLELKQKSALYRNRCEFEKAKNKTIKAAFAKMYCEFKKKDDEIAKLKKELNETKAQMERCQCKIERIKRNLKSMYIDLVANSDVEDEQ